MEADQDETRGLQRIVAEPTTFVLQDDSVALIDNPEWVLERYIEARDILRDLLDDGLPLGDMEWPIDDFVARTFMDVCTTLGPDCACNHHTATAGREQPHA